MEYYYILNNNVRHLNVNPPTQYAVLPGRNILGIILTNLLSDRICNMYMYVYLYSGETI